MRTSHRLSAGFFASVLAACSTHSSVQTVPALTPQSLTASSPAYTITDIGTLRGYGASIAFGINNYGEVVGNVETTGRPPVGVIGVAFKNGKLRSLGGLPGFTTSDAYAVNNLGVAVGDSCGSNGCHAVAFDASGAHDLGVVHSGGQTTAVAINDRGVAVGYSSYNETFPAAEFVNGRAIALGGSGYATAIDYSGTIVGWTNSLQAVFYTARAATPIPGLPTVDSYASSINNYGVVVGVAPFRQPNGKYVNRPFVYSHGKVVYLTLPAGGSGGASHINNRDAIVGNYTTSLGVQSAFIYANGVTRDLNSLLPPNSGWRIDEATSINDNGVVVGGGMHNGARRGFIMTPAR